MYKNYTSLLAISIINNTLRCYIQWLEDQFFAKLSVIFGPMYKVHSSVWLFVIDINNQASRICSTVWMLTVCHTTMSRISMMPRYSNLTSIACRYGTKTGWWSLTYQAWGQCTVQSMQLNSSNCHSKILRHSPYQQTFMELSNPHYGANFSC